MLIEGLTVNAEDVHLLSRDATLDAYRLMVLSRQIDKKELTLKRQGKTNFQIGGSGHEAIQVAAAIQLRPGHDWF